MNSTKNMEGCSDREQERVSNVIRRRGFGTILSMPFTEIGRHGVWGSAGGSGIDRKTIM